MTNLVLIVAYLGAVVLANLAVAHFGQAALPVTAFVLIPFDLVARDLLHQRWVNGWLWVKMSALIASGSLLTYAMNYEAQRVALASFVAFASAGSVDTVVFHMLRHKAPYTRINASNVMSAIVDSIVFPLVAFGETSFVLSASQAVAKIIGGFVWCILLTPWLKYERK